MFALYDDIEKLIKDEINILVYLKTRYKIDSTCVFFYSKEKINIDKRITDKIFQLKMDEGYLTIVALYFTDMFQSLGFVKKSEFNYKINFSEIIDITPNSTTRVIINEILTHSLFLEAKNA